MLALHKNLGSKGNQAYTLKCMGEVYAKSGDHQKALEHYNEALPLFREVGNRVEEALTLNNLGLTYSSLGARQKALEHFGQALRFWRAAGNKSEEAALTYQIARAERDSGNLIEAHRQIKAALEIFESLRAKLDIQELRASYLASTHEYYQLSVDILMRLHQHDPTGNYDAAALEASERARGRMLLETLVEGRANIRQGVEPTLLERERQLQQQLTAKADRLLRLVGGKHTEEQLTAAKGEIEALRTEYQQVQAQVRATSPRYAALTQPAPLRLAEIQKQVLDADTLLLEYSLGHEHSYLWAITPDSIASHELPKRAEVEAAARRVYDLLTARNRRLKYETADERRARVEQADRDFPQAARALSQMLLGPVAAQLKDKRLLVVGDGALQYVPFAALPLPIANHSDYVPLTVNHEIVSLPSASTLAVLRKEIQGRKPAPKSLLVLADPVFDATDDRSNAARDANPRKRIGEVNKASRLGK
jgi:tetratricopeptide (TPR) repeat protein